MNQVTRPSITSQHDGCSQSACKYMDVSCLRSMHAVSQKCQSAQLCRLCEQRDDLQEDPGHHMEYARSQVAQRINTKTLKTFSIL